MTCNARSGLPDASRRNTSGEIRSALTGALRTHRRGARRIDEHTDLARHRLRPSVATTNSPALVVAKHLDFAFEDDVRAIRDVADWRISGSPGAKHCNWLVNASSLRSDAERPLNSGTFCSISASSETSTQRLHARADAARFTRTRNRGRRLRQNTAWPQAAKGHDVTTFDDEFYRDILEGMAVHADSAFLPRHPRHDHAAPGAGASASRSTRTRWRASAGSPIRCTRPSGRGSAAC